MGTFLGIPGNVCWVFYDFYGFSWVFKTRTYIKPIKKYSFGGLGIFFNVYIRCNSIYFIWCFQFLLSETIETNSSNSTSNQQKPSNKHLKPSTTTKKPRDGRKLQTFLEVSNKKNYPPQKKKHLQTTKTKTFNKNKKNTFKKTKKKNTSKPGQGFPNISPLGQRGEQEEAPGGDEKTFTTAADVACSALVLLNKVIFEWFVIVFLFNGVIWSFSIFLKK